MLCECCCSGLVKLQSFLGTHTINLGFKRIRKTAIGSGQGKDAVAVSACSLQNSIKTSFKHHQRNCLLATRRCLAYENHNNNDNSNNNNNNNNNPDKHKRYHTYLKDKSNSNWKQFTTICNKVTTLLRNAKSVFVQSATTDATCSARLHRIWKWLKQKTATPIPDLYHSPHEATTAKDNASMLNCFFIQQSEQSVADSPRPTIPPIRTSPDITWTLHTITTSPEEVESLLKQLNSKKSPGHNGIPTRLLKESANELAPSLAVLHNLSFETGDISRFSNDEGPAKRIG